MSGGVKRKVVVNRRAMQARATRGRITDAALELFLAQGYAASTLEQIAAAAGVAVQTVYFHFGNKANLLKHVVDVLAAGDDEPVALLDRPWMQQIREQPDAGEALVLWLDTSRVIFARVASIMKIVRDAAGTDPEMSAQWETNQRQRLTAYKTFVSELATKKALKTSVSEQEATDIVFALVSPEVYYLLVVERGWTPEQWQTLISNALRTSLFVGT